LSELEPQGTLGTLEFGNAVTLTYEPLPPSSRCLPFGANGLFTAN